MPKLGATQGALLLALTGACGFSSDPVQQSDVPENDDTSDQDPPAYDAFIAIDDALVFGDGATRVPGFDVQLPDENASTCEGPSCLDVRCDEDHVGFPGVVPIRAWTASAEPIESYQWRLQQKPEGSAVAKSGPDAWSFEFTPDVEGTYVWCLTATSANHESGTACCEYSAFPDEFWYRISSEGLVDSIDDLEFGLGVHRIGFETNQPVTPDYDSLTYKIGNTTFDPLAGGGGYGERSFSVGALLASVSGDQVTLGRELVHEGDPVTVSIDVTSRKGSSYTVQTTLVLGSEPEPAAHAPVISAAEVDTTDPRRPTIRVRFADEHPAGTMVRLGGWEVSGGTWGEVSDDGLFPDATAGDGWYSGRLDYVGTLQVQGDAAGWMYPAAPGSYSVLVRALHDDLEGPSFRATIDIE
jgi:hypothetical protein